MADAAPHAPDEPQRTRAQRPVQDHDHGYKLLFSHAEMVRDLLTGFVNEPWLQELELDTLNRVSASYISDDLRDREGDIVWRVRFRGGWLYLYILLEFQSKVDRFMAIRMLGYLSLLYQDLIRQGPKAWQAPPDGATGATPGGPKGSLRLPPVLPIVLYNGRPRWTAATEVAHLIEPPPGRLARFTPRLTYLLLDEGALDEAAPLTLKNLAAALFRLDKSRSADTIEEVVASLMQWLTLPEQDSLRRAFTVYILRVLLPARAPGITVPEVADLLELRTMLAETVLDWKKQWLEEGQLRTLTRLLNKRFGSLPASIQARLQAATPEQLDLWTDRVLDAPTLQAVFDGQ